jgi:hypothetical protein
VVLLLLSKSGLISDITNGDLWNLGLFYHLARRKQKLIDVKVIIRTASSFEIIAKNQV